jgi:beta-N-acetylhexosaminidase
MTATIRHAAGSLLVVGLSGTELKALERAWLKLLRPAGVILFRRNIADAAQTRALLAESTGYCDRAHLSCVDIEGGTVDRLRDAMTPMPSAQAVAQAVALTGKPALMRQHGALIAQEAAAFGFNCTLAPVFDLALPASTAVMGTRAAAADPESVTRYARAFLGGLASHGVAGCGKHFPGLGGGDLDSHLGTPAIERGWNQLWREDLVPYQQLAGDLPMVMVNHATYPQTRSGGQPVTVSSYWVTSILQKRIGYRGLILSDDMEMGGILNFMPIEEAVVAAVRAGIHLIEICKSPELILGCYEALIQEGERSSAFRKILLKRAADGQRLRKGRFVRTLRRALTAPQFEALRKKIEQFSVVVAGSNQHDQ